MRTSACANILDWLYTKRKILAQNLNIAPGRL
jgi:hypothetical protein